MSTQVLTSARERGVAARGVFRALDPAAARVVPRAAFVAALRTLDVDGLLGDTPDAAFDAVLAPFAAAGAAADAVDAAAFEDYCRALPSPA